MQTAIKPGKKFKDTIKYIIIDNTNQKCTLVPRIKEIDLEEFRSLINKEFPGSNIEILELSSLKSEIYFLWPQIIKDFKDKFSYASSWLERARLELENTSNNNHLTINLEGKMAYKRLNTPRIISFLKDRFLYYLNLDIKIEIENGDFLEQIKETPFKIPRNLPNKPEIKKGDVKDKKNKPRKNKSTNNIIYGRKIAQSPTHNINEIQSEKGQAIIDGEIFKVDKRQTRSGKTLVIISLTDKSDSLTVKLFLDKDDELNSEINTGDWIRVRGRIQFDTYSNELTMMVNDMISIEPEVREDNAQKKRTELHLHTQMSAMDSVVDVDKVIKTASDWGHSALAITDHGVVQAYPAAYQAGKKYGVKILYGLEAYLVDDGEPIIINEKDQKIEDTTFVVFDLETTGLNPHKSEIIEIGAVKIENGKAVDEFSSFINPGITIPKKITEITGITDEMVVDAPKADEVLPEFLNFIKESVLVAHNASFDYGFLRSGLKNINMSLQNDNPVLDTLGLSRSLLPDLKNHKLNTIAKYLKVNLENHHRAVHDARATADILLEFLSQMNDKRIYNLNEINQLTSNAGWKNSRTYHTIILAKNMDGLKTIYKLVSNSHVNHFYRKPRVLKSELTHNREGLIIGTACEAGQLYRAIIQNKSNREIENLAKYYDFLEIQPIGNNEFLIPETVESREKLQEINSKIYNLGQKLNKPVIATGDVHFLEPEDEVYRKILQAGQGFNDYDNQAPLYYRTTEEMLEEFSYLGEEIAREVVIENPGKIADEIEEIKPVPDGLYTPKIEGADEQIRDMTYKRAHEMYGPELPEIVEKRIEKELNSIIDNGYAVIYLIAHKLVKKSLEDGYLVGSRGSVGSSLVATMCEITEVNPLPPHFRCPECKHVEFIEGEEIGVGTDLDDQECPECGEELIKDGFDIPFEVFLGFKGDKVPDIDLNFSGEYQSVIHQETEELFGRDYVFRAGTISTIADRTAFGFVKGFMDDNNLNFRKAETNRLVQGCTGVRRTTGQHPGGQIVVPNDLEIYDFTPIQKPANDMETNTLTTHFDFHSIHDNLLKLDILGHDDPTSLRMLQDITEIEPGSIPLDDPDTMSIFSSTQVLDVDPEEIGSQVGTLGIPEFGTSFVRQMLVDTKPTTFAELIRISGLSHGTDVWLNNAQDLIRQGKAKLSEVISVRDDIMNYLIQKDLEPGKAFWIMEHVRKGKGLTEDEENYMRECGVPDWYINSCKKIKYMFPKAHAAAYVMMAFRIAYFKVHHPEAFYATYFSNKASDFDAQIVGKGYKYICKKKEELENQDKLTAKDKNTLTILEIVIEAILRGIEFVNVDLYESEIDTFKITEDGLLPPLICLQGLGKSAAEDILEARKQGEFTSIEELVNKTSISKTVVEVLREHGSLDGLPEKNQLSLF